MTDSKTARHWSENDVAIVGMAAHLPGAPSVEAFWSNLRAGVESITRLDEAALTAAGELRARLRAPNYVPAAAMLDGFERFDADFFGFSPREAAIMDPQHRQFLETAWEALESAGHPPETFDGPIGVYAGCGMGSYFYFNICSNRDLVDSTGMFLLRHTGNDKDFLSTRLSHILDLKGPSITLQTACSTSLVATHYAVQSLLNGECDMALAGGVTIELPQGRGYLYQEGEILSPDGHCHAFDHRAQGTVFGSGSGVVVLRRMADAVADGDHIWAVIKGSAVNNDGAAKAGYLAPSVDGQAAAVAEAQAMADVTADTIDYVECHGTGTYLGDPIEVAALTEAFRETTQDTGFCRIGSVKSNIGHLDTAAGVASLIKASLALHHREMPPSIGYEKPNPAIDFDNSPFRVNDRLTEWTSRSGPRRAGVNSLGVGGTNAHVVLQEAPERPESEPSDWPMQLLTISGRTQRALDENTARLAAHLRTHPEEPLADVAWTLKEGRRAFEKRRVVVAETHEEAARLLEDMDPRRVFTHAAVGNAPDVAFMFPGGGAQYVGMARDLYDTEPVFRDWMDRGLDILQPQVGFDVRALWLAEGEEAEAAARTLRKPSVQLPLIMIVEYALAQLWMSWGVTPSALVGHSMGENTAACLAGVMSFDDCIGLVLLRGQLFDTVPAGGMLSVPLPVEEVAPRLGDDLDIASVNAPDLTVVSGPDAALEALRADLAAQEIETQRIAIDIAAHSRMLDPILEKFGDYLRSIPLGAPRIPIISNRTGQPLTEAEARDPDYWVGHLRHTVRFADCLTTLAQTDGRIFIEMGPGKALSSLARIHGAVARDRVLSALRHPDEDIADDSYFLGALGQVWACGGAFDWTQVWGEARRNRVVLPTYAFQRAPYFIEPGQPEAAPEDDLLRREDRSEWGYRPVWRPKLAECDWDVGRDLAQAPKASWLFFLDGEGVGAAMVERLRAAGHDVVGVTAGDGFARTGEDSYTLAPERGREGYDALIADLMARGRAPERVVHLWLLTGEETFRPGSSFFHRNQEQGFYSLLFLAQAMSDDSLPKPLHVTAVTSGAARVRDEALRYPEKSTILGPVQVIPRELPGVTCAAVDVETPPRKGGAMARTALAEALLEDVLAPPRDHIAAHRGSKRFERQYRPAPLEEAAAPVWQAGATYLITGGFGGIGLTLADGMARAGANIVLLARGGLPARQDWPHWLETHPPQDRISRRIRAVQRLEALGGTVMVVAGDVCNIDDMEHLRDTVAQRFGRVTGVIHAAGVIDDGPLLAKGPASTEGVLAPKLHGTEVIEAVFPDGSIDWLVLFSSSSTVTAPAGQVDYVAANAFLNAYAEARTGGRTRVSAINWGIWSDTGMAAEAVAGRLGQTPPAPSVPINAPLLDASGFDEGGNRVFTATLDRGRWVIDQHRTRDGAAILPGTGYLELIAEALRAQGEAESFEIRDLLFLRPLPVEDDSKAEIRLRLRRSDEGYEVELHSRVHSGGREGWQLHAEGRVILPAPARPAPVDLAALRARIGDLSQSGGAAIPSAQEGQLRFGPHWQVLRGLAQSGEEGLAELSLDPALAAEAGDMPLHPGLLDIATGWAMALVPGYGQEHLWVPVSYGALRVFAPLPHSLRSHVRLASGSAAEETAQFDVTLTDPQGQVCAEISRLTVRRMADGAAFARAPAPAPHEIEPAIPDPQAQQPLSPAEERLRHNLSQGIPAAEGEEMFARALATGLRQIVVSSLDLDALTRQAAQAADSSGPGGQSFERPQLDTDYVAPENDIERTLCGFWQELLGVDRVGTRDSFFDLGGHSLVAVRLFAKVKKTYHVDFPISVLFEAPTVAQCAALIAAQIGPQDAQGAGGAIAEPVSRRYTHLVPMHEGEGGPKTPFFLVAGMFGNVLNLRHLAQLLGADRPFYGVQARGLYGDAAPHDDLTEAARDYIAEIRQVQPHGPYLLGGFSGGGITAYEMARQLEAAGETVAVVVLLDTPLPVRRPLTLGDRLRIQLSEVRRQGPLYPVKWLRNRVAWELAKRRAPDRTEAAEGGQRFHNAEIEAAFIAATERYRMHRWAGRVDLFRPPLRGKWSVGGGRLVSGERAYVLHDNDWGEWVGDLGVTEVPGDHDSMVLEPNVRVLAARMKRAIEAAEQARETGTDLPRAAE
ncbi:Acyl transferase domain-containing protein [Salinihabitans flavidus]|uniref:Phenolphthiocerol/phthiocerol polyketide synthase subunit E n=1 Tax=Salinihabitans flavidus TaxID=569882 RepID=A0A1H8QTM0_9RHOB|nr:type I polyketide synthase [Salinihabitans flavidus]SEO57318.1 Acyl transferase domain-containing protein [Salinihabitans flavidus]